MGAVDAVGGDSSVNRVSGTFPTRKRHPIPPTRPEQPCKYCGNFHPRGIEHCPAAKARCKSCSKIGHFTQVCQSRKYHDDNAHAVGLDPASTHLPYNGYDMAYTVAGQSTADLFTITLQVDGKPCTGLLDTGATRTILTSDIVQPTRQADRVLRAYNGGVVDTLGIADVTITSGGHVCTYSCFVVAEGSQWVLFSRSQCRQHQASLHICRPSSQARRTASSPTSVQFIVKELERLVAADIIEPVKEASAWVSPIVPVLKSNGTLRLCVDYRQLNESIVRERHAVPTVDEITAELEGATVFSVLDAESGFHQLSLDKESQTLTKFAAHCGLFRFKRLLFGVSCAPEIFQRVVSDILSGLPGVVVYIDDILVFGHDRAEHDERLANVLARLKSASLKLNWDKCRIGPEQVKYLGHILTRAGVQPDSNTLSAIQDMAPPKSATDVQRFLGMVTYLGKFVLQLTAATEPLLKLMKRESFSLDDDLLRAFESVKLAMASSLHTLAYFRSSSSVPTAVSCDASPSGLGAILWQQSDKGQWLPVTCASRTLTDVETRYSQVEREMLGIVFTLTRFRQYALGRHIEVYTDHKSLLPIVQKPFDDVPPRLQRWLVSLMPYDYALKYVPGKQLSCTDALSRAPVSTSDVSAAESRSLHEYNGLVLEASPGHVASTGLVARADKRC